MEPSSGSLHEPSPASAHLVDALAQLRQSELRLTSALARLLDAQRRLAESLMRLRASQTRLLETLRDRFPAARSLPLAPAAVADPVGRLSCRLSDLRTLAGELHPDARN